MGEVINLRRVRKRARKAEAETEAATNRARFGRTREQSAIEAAEAGRAARTLDGARLDQPAEALGEENRMKDRDTTS